MREISEYDIYSSLTRHMLVLTNTKTCYHGWNNHKWIKWRNLWRELAWRIMEAGMWMMF